MIVREATAVDWPEVADFFLTTPLEAGTAFVLDRRPDFGALPGLRGEFRTFLVFQGKRLAGTVTALWHAGRDGAHSIKVGELIDFRVASWARGGRASIHLLRAVNAVFAAERVDWIVCLIGKQNQAAIPLVAKRAGLPRLAPLEDFASVHFMAWRVPPILGSAGIKVRVAEASDAALVIKLCGSALDSERFAPVEPIEWPDPSGRHRAWIAVDPDGSPCGVLLLWDGELARRIRIVRYRTADLPVRMIAGIAARCGLAVPLPPPGGVLGIWASRVVVIRRGGGDTLRALLGAALSAAAAAGRNVVQLNLHRNDPLLDELPPYPRSTYWSTLFGAPCRASPVPLKPFTERHHADLARA